MKPIVKGATLFILDDPNIAGQILFAVTKEGCFWVPAPESGVMFSELTKAREYIGQNRGMWGNTADLLLAAISEAEAPPS